MGRIEPVFGRWTGKINLEEVMQVPKAKRRNIILKVLLIILMVFIVFIVICYINHRILLVREKELREPLGQLVEVNGNKMSVYVEGTGDKTLVFMSGGGTSSRILCRE